MGRDLNDIHREDGAEAVRKIIADAQPPGGAGLVTRRASDIEPEAIDFLWPGRLARGKHTAIAGDPGDGKSQISIYVAAMITTGGMWPCLEGVAPVGNVIFLSAEDGAADTIVPRLIAAGADLERVHIVSAVREESSHRRAFNLQADLALLEKKIVEIGNVALVVIDPISSYMGRTDSHKNAEVRSVLEPASEMAERMRVAILSITHFSKAGTANNTKALHRFIGSIAFTGAPRAAFAVVADPDNEGRMLFLHGKNNMAPKPQGLAYRLEQTILPEPHKAIPASRVVWEAEPVTISADEAMAPGADSGGSQKADYVEFLQVVLADGPMKVKPDIEQEAREAGLLDDGKSLSQSKPCRKAREQLGVVASKGGYQGKWTWALPSKMPSEPKDAPLNKRAPLENEGTFAQQSCASPCPKCSGEGCDCCRKPASRPAPASNGKATVEPPMDPDGLLPDIPDFLDRRPPR